MNALLAALRWVLSMFEEKRDGARRLSMKRVVIAYLVIVVGRELRMPMGWPDASVVWSLAFALGIAAAIDRADSEDILGAVSAMFSRGAAAQPAWPSGAVGEAAALPAGPQPLGEAELMPPLTHGRPEPEPGEAP